jgi:proteasome assembly chaperone (PAC2) family protein
MALSSGAELVGLVDPEDFYDFLFSRPQVTLDEDGQRQITWPGAELYAPNVDLAADPAMERLYFLLGSEPSRRWKAFVAEILELITDQDIQAVIFLGSIPADSPHTRPISVVAHSQNELVRAQTGAERSGYQGPVGIQSVLAIELERLGIPTVALWASIPHYVQNGPSPKAMLALVAEVERYVKVSFDQKDLATEAFQWERNIDELAENDEEMASYIEQLEQSRDATDSEAASGDVLAMEFERFLASQSDEDADGGSAGEEPNKN